MNWKGVFNIMEETLQPDIRKLLGKQILFFDGGMGTLLQERGLGTGEIPETWNILHPEEIRRINREYFLAGSNIVNANTFGVNAYKCKNLDYTVQELVSEGVRLAAEARSEARKELSENGRAKEAAAPMYVALDIGSIGKLLKPLGEISFDEAYDTFKEVVVSGEKSGADLILIETVSDSYEIKAAVLAAKENSSLPVIVTMIFDENGKLLTGGDVASATAMLEGLGVDAIGFNCGLGPRQMKQLLPQLTECCSLPIVINANAGLPSVINGNTVYNVSPDEFADDVAELVRMGACVVGGCCGTTPEHIANVVAKCRELPIIPVTDKEMTVVSSYNHAVCFGKKPLIIGERINPTGKSKFKQALKEHDMEYIYREGLMQEEKGAHILDVNVGLPEIDEPKFMEEAVTGLQAVVDLPLQIDTSDISAMERGLRYYNGKPMLNSVNGKKESMEAVFPIAKKYGAVVVCLCLDENGIPETAEGRVAVAKKIIETAATYGIPRKNLVMDALVLTISTGSENAVITLDALRQIRYGLGVHTVLGVSNISFGLPERTSINTAFFTMAMNNGLSAGIINPSSEQMMSAYYSFNALIGEDDQCMEYIATRSGGGTKPDNSAKSNKDAASNENKTELDEAIIKGLTQSAYDATVKLLEQKMDSLEIINEKLIPALDVVGKGFEEKRMFLPQLLMSAEAAKASFEAIKEHFAKLGASNATKGKIVIATVKGDIHDIGKNIVKTLLENYGFDVIDLGKDVDAEIILQTVKEQNVKLVGLSALMTTTVANMQDTIKLLRDNNAECRIMVGGAVLTQEYADMIGADFYSKDAMGSVRYANELSDSGMLV